MKMKTYKTNIYNENNGPPGYHHNGFVATYALGHMMYGGDIQEGIILLL